MTPNAPRPLLTKLKNKRTTRFVRTHSHSNGYRPCVLLVFVVSVVVRGTAVIAVFLFFSVLLLLSFLDSAVSVILKFVPALRDNPGLQDGSATYITGINTAV